MNNREYRDIDRWYSGTYVYIRGVPVLARHFPVKRFLEEDDNEVEVSAIVTDLEGNSLSLDVSSVNDIVPIKMSSRIVDTGTVFGHTYVSVRPRRQYKKSLYMENLIMRPLPDYLVNRVFVYNYIKNSPTLYSPEEAKERVLSGAALWSAVSNKILIGAVLRSPRFLCAYKGRLVGGFSLEKGEPNVNQLVLSKPNGFLLESISEALPGVVCRVAR